MFDKISLKAMCTYEKLTGKNSVELFQKETKSATDMRDIVYLLQYTKDNTITFEKIENMSGEEFQKALSILSEETSKN